MLSRRTRSIITFALTFSVFSTAAPAAVPSVTFAPYEFKARDGATIAVERGEISVPENRRAKRPRH